ncbi:MAG: fibronectin type III domain-containing protein [Gallionellaceae bacterium]|nr:fibronectin type III domain-containing protein [Gallionellaceae bacterium]
MRNNNLKKILALALLFTASSVFAATKPGVPTNIVATANSTTTASITFTPPANNGGAVITSYTVNCSPACSPASGPASPITVNGLTAGTPYTFTVTATNSIGTSLASAVSNSAPTCSAAEYFVGEIEHYSYKASYNVYGGGNCQLADGCYGYVVAQMWTCSNLTGSSIWTENLLGPAHDNSVLETLYQIKQSGKSAFMWLDSNPDPAYLTKRFLGADIH